MNDFRWRGDRILDIRAWAASRGERMVSYRAERTVPNALTGELDIEIQEGEMPESFWFNLLMQDGWMYRERETMH